ncbi:hypothetical protein [Phenylobacterium sp.]|uniref:hypothetical protein n=2 Tax=Phenylobacterium sp. TaxID=1871053 RepID=UPI0025DE9FC2|nr:hypothetical protein [Phenylobacterium sp.]MCA6361144.1 hypothetical protein [Phenylobacterium sp.]
MAEAVVVAAKWVAVKVFQFAVSQGVQAGTAASLMTVAKVVAQVAITAGISSALGAALSPKIGGDFGSQIDFKADPRGPVPYAMGRTGTAGNVVFAQTAGDKNKYLNYATVYSAAGPIDSYESFLINGTPVTFGTDAGEGASGYYQNRMWRRTQLGARPEAGRLQWTATGTKDTPADHSGLPAEWTTAHKLSGLAADLWCLQYNTTVYSSGPPRRLTVAKWVKVYDPRLDSTFPGGSGPQRSDNEATWAWSENPYVHALTWCLGRHVNGVRVMGLGAPLSAIDVAAFVEGANIADANDWTLGGVVYSTDDKWEVLTAMLQAGAGRPMRLGAKISCLVSTPRTSLATLTADDVVGEAQITGTPSRRTRINTVWPKYREESQGWEMVATDASVQVAAHITADGGKVRSREIQYGLVQNSVQAAQLARYDIENSREFQPVVLPCKPAWMAYKPGDCITVDVPEFGLVSRKMLILRRQRDPATLITTLTLVSETDGKHPFALGSTLTPPATPGLNGYDPNQSTVVAAGSWTATGTALTGPDGSTQPAIVFEGEVEDPNVTRVIAETRLSLGGGNFGDWMSSEHSPQIRRIEVRGLLPSSDYHCRIRYRTALQAEGLTGLDLGIKTTGALSVPGTLTSINGLTPAQLTAQLDYVTDQGRQLTQAVLESFNRLLDERIATYQATLHKGQPVKKILIDESTDWTDGDVSAFGRFNLLGAVTPGGGAFVLNETTVKVSPTETLAEYKSAVAAAQGANAAAILSESSARATADGAIATSVTAVVAQSNANAAAIATEVTARTTADSALASSLSTVSTTVNGNTSSISTLQSSVNGISAEWVLALNANGRVAGIKAAVGPTVSTLAFQADQIAFSNGTVNYFPLSIVGGEVRAQNFRVDKVVANSIVSESILGGAVTTQVSASTNPVTAIGATPVQVISLSITTVGGPVQVGYDCQVGLNASFTGGLRANVYRNGTLLRSAARSNMKGPFQDGLGGILRDTPGAGTHTYTIELDVPAGASGTLTSNVNEIMLTELKK